MKVTKRNKILVGLSVFGVMAIGCGIAAQNSITAAADTPLHANLNNLGASVNLEESQVRFVFDLKETGSHVDLAEGETAGVIVIPADLFEGELTMETADTATATLKWEEGVGYAYLPVGEIPATQYNRRLAFRGYVEKDGAYTYTDTAYASMAYVAYKNYDAYEGDSEKQAMLDTYRGNYTISYMDGDSLATISGMKYGEKFEGEKALPATVDGLTVDSWYWDAACTDDIAETDYVTGSMQIYYEVLRSGTITLNDVAAENVVVEAEYADGTVETLNDVTVADDGSVSLATSATALRFSGDGKAAYVLTVADGFSAEMTDAKYEISSGAFALRADSLSGKISVLSNSYAYLMPNLSTQNDYTFTVGLTHTTAGSAGGGIALSNGTDTLVFWVHNSDENGGASGQGFDNGGATIYVTYNGSLLFRAESWQNTGRWRTDPANEKNQPIELTITKTAESMKVNVMAGSSFGNRWFTAYADGTIEPRLNDKGEPFNVYIKDAAANAETIMASFFGEGVTHTVGYANASNVTVATNYEVKAWTVTEPARTLSGTITLNGVAAANIVVEAEYADGTVETLNDVTVADNGSVSLVNTEATALRFSGDGKAAYVLAVADGFSAEMTDAKYEISSSSFALRADSLDGNISVQESNYAYLMPNLSTANNYKFEMVLGADGSKSVGGGVALSNGTDTLILWIHSGDANESGQSYERGGATIFVTYNGRLLFREESWKSAATHWKTEGGSGVQPTLLIERTDTYTEVRVTLSSTTFGARYFRVYHDGRIEPRLNNNGEAASGNVAQKADDAETIMAQFFADGVTHTLGYGNAGNVNAPSTWTITKWEPEA